MSDKAVQTAGTKLEIKTGTSTYLQVFGMTDITDIGGGSAAVIDATDLSSTAKEKVMGLPDEGQVSVSLIHVPKDAGQAAVRAARGTRVATGFRVTLPDGTIYAFNAFVLTYSRSAAADDIVKVSVSLEITGAITETVPV